MHLKRRCLFYCKEIHEFVMLANATNVKEDYIEEGILDIIGEIIKIS
ncbi:hypothetical protein ACFLKB_12740 [Clostridium sp. FAM 1755]